MNKSVDHRRYLAGMSLILSSLICLSSIRSGESGILRAVLQVGADSIGFPVKNFKAVFVDKDNTKWFLTDQGIVSLKGEKWTLHNGNRKVKAQDMNGFAYENNASGSEVWIASPGGVTVAGLPIDARTGATTYTTEKTPILSNNVLRVAIGKTPMRWFGTDKGISGFLNDKWLTPSYEELYPSDMFAQFPITSMATTRSGDSLYIGTEGAGVSRVYRDDVDGISGASAYAQWGPIILPSDKIYSMFIAPDGKEWFGTDMGVALHTGNNSMENWTAYNTAQGLINNFVQAIAGDAKGRIWFGTKEGVSVYDGTTWTSYTIKDGLTSNNILCITVDARGIVWLGTDDGVTSFDNGKFKSYR